MKKSPLLMMIVGAALALLSSCTSSGLYVVDDVGEPLEGVVLEPVALTYGCQYDHHTGPCGHACVPDPQRVNLRRLGYHSILGVELYPGRPTYVQMQAIGMGGNDRPSYWHGGTGYHGK